MSSFALVPLLAALQGAGAPIDDPLLRAVPKDAVVVVNVPRVAELRARAAENAWVKLLRGPELEPVLTTMFEAFSLPMMEDGESRPLTSGEEAEEDDPSVAVLGEKLDRVLAQLDGLCLFFEAAASGPEPGILIAAGPERDELDRWLDHFVPGRGVVDRADEAGLEIEVRQVGEAGETTHFAHLELPGLSAWLGGAGHDRALERARGVGRRWNDARAAGSILTSERFAAARRDLGRRPVVELYVDVHAMVQRAIEEDPPDEAGARILEAINVEGLSWAHGSFDIGAGERFEFELAVKLPESGYLRTWAGMLGPAPIGMARWIPRDVSSACLSRVDVNGIYRSVLAMLEEAAPAQYQEMRAGMEMVSQSTGVDFEADILGQLTGNYASFELAPPATEDSASPGAPLGLSGLFLSGGMVSSAHPFATAAYLIALNDPAIVEQALDDLVATAEIDDQVAAQEREGVVVSSIDIEGDFGPRWAFLPDHLLVAFSDRPIDAALAMHAEEPPPTVLDNHLLGPVLRSASGEAYVSVADTRALVRFLTEMLADMPGGMDEFDQAVEEAFEEEAEGEADPDTGQVFDIETPSPADESEPPQLPDLARHFSGVLVNTFGARDGVLRMRFYGQ